MDASAWAIVAVVVVAVVALVAMARRRAWNADGSDDARRGAPADPATDEDRAPPRTLP